LTVTGSFCRGQEDKPAISDDFRPSSVNQPGKPFPQVNSEGRVRVRISAPDAKMVQPDIGGMKYNLTKMKQGGQLREKPTLFWII